MQRQLHNESMTVLPSSALGPEQEHRHHADGPEHLPTKQPLIKLVWRPSKKYDGFFRKNVYSKRIPKRYVWTLFEDATLAPEQVWRNQHSRKPGQTWKNKTSPMVRIETSKNHRSPL